MFTTAAGKTTAPNNPIKAPGKPTMKYAEAKNTTPETIVPTAVNVHTVTRERLNLFATNNKPKKISAVIGLSIMLAICPPGKEVVNAAMIPVTEPSNSTLFISGKRIIPKNIIVNNISGFIPNKIGGATI